MSGAGLESTAVRTMLKLDRSAPTVAARSSRARAWSAPVRSGCAAATSRGSRGCARWAGGSTAARAVAPGDEAAVEVGADGRHRIAYRATDAAGNGSAEQAVDGGRRPHAARDRGVRGARPGRPARGPRGGRRRDLGRGARPRRAAPRGRRRGARCEHARRRPAHRVGRRCGAARRQIRAASAWSPTPRATRRSATAASDGAPATLRCRCGGGTGSPSGAPGACCAPAHRRRRPRSRPRDDADRGVCAGAARRRPGAAADGDRRRRAACALRTDRRAGSGSGCPPGRRGRCASGSPATPCCSPPTAARSSAPAPRRGCRASPASCAPVRRSGSPAGCSAATYRARASSSSCRRASAPAGGRSRRSARAGAGACATATASRRPARPHVRVRLRVRRESEYPFEAGGAARWPCGSVRRGDDAERAGTMPGDAARGLAATDELIGYLGRYGARTDEVLERVRAGPQRCRSAEMQVSADQGALIELLVRLIGAQGRIRGRDLHRLQRDLHRARAGRRRAADVPGARRGAGGDRAEQPRRRRRGRPGGDPRRAGRRVAGGDGRRRRPTTSRSSTPTSRATRSTTSRAAARCGTAGWSCSTTCSRAAACSRRGRTAPQIIDALNRHIHADERVDMAMTISADGLTFVRVR